MLVRKSNVGTKARVFAEDRVLKGVPQGDLSRPLCFVIYGNFFFGGIFRFLFGERFKKVPKQ